jgi:ribosome biogenesis protein Nip4
LVQETKHVFEKLHKYVGKDIKTLIDRSDASYVIRLQKNRVFYVREDIMRRATNVSHFLHCVDHVYVNISEKVSKESLYAELALQNGLRKTLVTSPLTCFNIA